MDKPWYRRIFPDRASRTLSAAGPAADPDDAVTQFNLGLLCATGSGERRNYVEAARWYLKAAGQSHVLAQFNLGVMYAAGLGVERDDAESAVWFLKAASQGDAGAQYRLGQNCQRASYAGPPEHAAESLIEAYKWYQLAAAQGYADSTQSCYTLTIHMSREDIADANRRAAAFAPAHSDN